MGHVGPLGKTSFLFISLELLKFCDFLSFPSKLKLSYSNLSTYCTLNYASSVTVEEVMKLYNLNHFRHLFCEVCSIYDFRTIIQLSLFCRIMRALLLNQSVAKPKTFDISTSLIDVIVFPRLLY